MYEANPELTPEEIFGTPSELKEDAYWLNPMPHLRRLTAFCITGWHDVAVGEKWRWMDEQVRLDETRTTSYDSWSRLSTDFGQAFVLHCDKCGKSTRMVRKGWAWAS